MITQLIDKQDNFELIRDQIAAILATESASQQALASAAGKNPAAWELSVYSERANAWERWLNAPSDAPPVINVWFDRSNFDKAQGSTVERQAAEAVFNIDCYGYGQSSADGSGQIPGDEAAALNAQAAFRLVRNILMSAEYTYLGLRGLVWQRWPQSVTSLQPQLDGQAVQHVVALRLAFAVTFNEFAPQYEAEPLEQLGVSILRADDGKLLAQADYDYT